MKTFEITIIVLVMIAFLRLLYLVYKDKKYKWHQPEVIPEPMPHNERISKDIIIRDLTTEKEFRGYYDYYLDRFMDYNSKMVWGVIIWRYDD